MTREEAILIDADTMISMLKITLELKRNTPLSLADAIISLEYEKWESEYDVAVEEIREIGKALVSHAEAQDKIKRGDTE